MTSDTFAHIDIRPLSSHADCGKDDIFTDVSERSERCAGVSSRSAANAASIADTSVIDTENVARLRVGFAIGTLNNLRS